MRISYRFFGFFSGSEPIKVFVFTMVKGCDEIVQRRLVHDRCMDICSINTYLSTVPLRCRDEKLHNRVTLVYESRRLLPK